MQVGMWGMLVAMGALTARRNRDWADEDSLFRAALQVCPRSAKVQVVEFNSVLKERECGYSLHSSTVQLNMGILCRRQHQYTQALGMHARQKRPRKERCDTQKSPTNRRMQYQGS